MKAIPPEHRFNVSLEEWEEAVFTAANHFTVFRRFGPWKREIKTFESFLDAIEDAGSDKTALIYAVTLSGRSVCLVRARWPRYQQLWSERHPV